MRKEWSDSHVWTYLSLLAPTYPPSPIDIAPAISSASPPRITTLVSPRAVRPAVRANGTVSPSESPRIASETTRALMRKSQSGQNHLRRRCELLSERKTDAVWSRGFSWSVDVLDRSGRLASRSAAVGSVCLSWPGELKFGTLSECHFSGAMLVYNLVDLNSPAV
ncbi:hypothetical protein, variant [Cladophialophora immunda]|uniref:Uncharacterized protein n=1 Tax=Cladophialophora immunda TaxID=569365 RepID=A0A0D2CPH7_9EURO|nr:uncharacterized protein PV07_03497 [Cladophialophora immunda]XP_016252126.1 hypothetical protein, variant [Cladophialophora immunda]KIW31909.1 hypothetical protein PV07_03497 [Cladophialophora immunda]KIW31910.1 hypothetical protein, variant [Cladophialophora immunda]